MRSKVVWAATVALAAGLGTQAAAQRGATAPGLDPGVRALVERLDLERYKATVKGLTQFGDRRQGTDRNRAAVDWIEAQLKSYGCPAERIKYKYKTPPPNPIPIRRQAGEPRPMRRRPRRAVDGPAASGRARASTRIPARSLTRSFVR